MNLNGFSKSGVGVSLIPRLSPHPDKNENGVGEPGIDLHVILWHGDITAIITKVVTQLCSHVQIDNRLSPEEGGHDVTM